jgi:hypothetical protein
MNCFVRRGWQLLGEGGELLGDSDRSVQKMRRKLARAWFYNCFDSEDGKTRHQPEVVPTNSGLSVPF